MRLERTRISTVHTHTKRINDEQLKWSQKGEAHTRNVRMFVACSLGRGHAAKCYFYFVLSYSGFFVRTIFCFCFPRTRTASKGASEKWTCEKVFFFSSPLSLSRLSSCMEPIAFISFIHRFYQFLYRVLLLLFFFFVLFHLHFAPGDDEGDGDGNDDDNVFALHT